jgi:hypothetical protein
MFNHKNNLNIIKSVNKYINNNPDTSKLIFLDISRNTILNQYNLYLLSLSR